MSGAFAYRVSFGVAELTDVLGIPPPVVPYAVLALVCVVVLAWSVRR